MAVFQTLNHCNPQVTKVSLYAYAWCHYEGENKKAKKNFYRTQNWSWFGLTSRLFFFFSRRIFRVIPKESLSYNSVHSENLPYKTNRKSLRNSPEWCSNICKKPKLEKWSDSHSVMSDSLWLHGLYSPWNSLGQNTGGDGLFLLHRQIREGPSKSMEDTTWP